MWEPWEEFDDKLDLENLTTKLQDLSLWTFTFNLMLTLMIPIVLLQFSNAVQSCVC